MTQKEIKDKIADWENRLKNPSVAGVPSAVTKINSEIAKLEAMLEKEEKPKAEKKEKVAKEPKKELSKDKLKEIRAEYEENEDNNAHSENTVLLAKYFGTKAELEKANDILEKHNKLGSIPQSLNDERHELNKKLYKKFVDLERKGTEHEAKETKSEEKAEHKKADYNCDDLIKEAKERHAKAKAAAEARAEAPKKSEATKDKEKIEKVHETFEKHIEKGKFTKPQLEKLIAETKDLLKLLEKALKNL